MKRKKLAILAIFAIAILFTGCSKKGDSTEVKKDTSDFPKKDIHIIVPYNAGGGVDITSRVFADIAKTEESLKGNSIVVENKGGAGAVVGQTYVSQAEPDGYTVLAYTNAAINNPKLKDVTYNIDSFKPLAMICFDPDMLVMPPNSKFNNLEEFIAYAKENTVKVATPGFATVHHLAAVILEQENNLKFEYLHNDSAAVQMQQIMGGHCDVAFVSVGEATSSIQDGTIKGLGVMNDERIESIKDVPTFKENGYDMTYGAFRGFAVSSNVPEEEYNELKKIFEKVGASDELKEALMKANIPYSYKDGDTFLEYVKKQDESLDKILPILQQAK